MQKVSEIIKIVQILLKYMGILFILRWVYGRLKPWQWGVGVTFIIICVAVLYIPYLNAISKKLASQFIEKTGLQVQNLMLEGRKYTNQAEIMRAIGLQDTKMSMFMVDISAMQQRIAHLGWVKNVRISRTYPDTLYVHITERIPVAVLQRKGTFTLIDGEGMHIGQDNIDQFSHLKVLLGEDVETQVSTFFDFINTDTNLKPIVQSAEYISKRRWDVILQGDIRVHLPAKNPKQAWVLLGQLVQKKDLLARSIDTIDLRIEGRVSICFKKQCEDKSA